MELRKIKKYFKRHGLGGLSPIKLLKHTLATKHIVWGDEARLEVGDNIQLNDAILNTGSGNIIIGDNVFFGHGVMILTGGHHYTKKDKKRKESIVQSGNDIKIQSGVWIGSNATIIGPCDIRENTVIAAGSVVINDCEPNSVYAGNPAELIKKIDFEE